MQRVTWLCWTRSRAVCSIFARIWNFPERYGNAFDTDRARRSGAAGDAGGDQRGGGVPGAASDGRGLDTSPAPAGIARAGAAELYVRGGPKRRLDGGEALFRVARGGPFSDLALSRGYG